MTAACLQNALDANPVVREGSIEMFFAYHRDYVIDLGTKHRFPMAKYGLVYNRLIKEKTLDGSRQISPHAASARDLALVHSMNYIARFQAGHMSDKEIRRLGLPWSPRLARRAALAVQGTIEASMMAKRHGLSANLAGGSHHAFATHGEGFSVFNDMAVAIRVLQRDCGLHRAAVIDCDVHQGNGTASIFCHDRNVFTCSLHGEKNYPFHKVPSDLDIALPDGTDDAMYLDALQKNIPAMLGQFKPNMVWYQAGVDPYYEDRLGRLSLSLHGLQLRDEYVLTTCAAAGIPVVVAMGGGYARDIDNIVEAHCNTLRVAARVLGRTYGT